MQIFSHKFVYLAQFQSAIWLLIFSVEYYRFTKITTFLRTMQEKSHFWAIFLV